MQLYYLYLHILSFFLIKTEIYEKNSQKIIIYFYDNIKNV